MEDLNRALHLQPRLQSWLAFPRCLWLSLSLATLLALPGLWTGFFIDDLFHIIILEGGDLPGQAIHLFRFGPGDSEAIRPYMDVGIYPWWTLPEFKANFWRPISCLLARLDHSLFARKAFFYHIHSLLWYLLLISGLGILFKKKMTAFTGGLALLLFAVDDVHWFPVTWIANRNALLAATLALWGFLAHLKWRESARVWGAPLSLLGYGLGLLAGETALSVLAYVATYELLGRKDAWRGKILGLTPMMTMVFLYLFLYKTLDYGAYGSGLYIDPIREPLPYLREAPFRLLSLLGTLLLSVPSDPWAFIPLLRPLLIGSGIAGILLFLWLTKRLRGDIPEEDWSALCWMVPGAFLSLLPLACTFPSNRLLLVPSLGSNAFIASLLVAIWTRKYFGRLQRAVGLSGIYLAITGLLLPMASWPLHSLIVHHFMQKSHTSYLEAEMDDERIESQHVILLVAPEPLTCLYPILVRTFEGYPRPIAWRVLSSAPYSHRLSRPEPNVLELEVVDGVLLGSDFERLTRSSRFPFKKGDHVFLEGMMVTILETRKGYPYHIRFSFEQDLDSSLYHLLKWDKGLHHIEVPAPGDTLFLPRLHPLY